MLDKQQDDFTSLFAGPALPALGHAVAGSTGAAVSNVCTYPLALVVMRLQIQRQLFKTQPAAQGRHYKSIQDAVRRIYGREGGWLAFYAGLLQDTTKTVADSFLFFLAYTFLRQSRLRSRKPSGKQLPVLDELGVGFLAGAFAKLLTTPLATVVTRKQSMIMLSTGSKSAHPEDTSVRRIIEDIMSEKGFRGLWAGYSASLVLTMNPSITFFLFESFKRLFLSRHQRASPSSRTVFILAAFSKAIASSITYPFSLAKARAQVVSKRDLDDASDNLGDHKSKGRACPQPSKSGDVPRNVFSLVLHIARHEGVGVLYEGLDAEILKGFFSHGITMITKEAAHKLIIQLYYATLRILNSYPSPLELAEPGKERISQIARQMEKQAEQADAVTSHFVKDVALKG